MYSCAVYPPIGTTQVVVKNHYSEIDAFRFIRFYPQVLRMGSGEYFGFLEHEVSFFERISRKTFSYSYLWFLKNYGFGNILNDAIQTPRFLRYWYKNSLFSSQNFPN